MLLTLSVGQIWADTKSFDKTGFSSSDKTETKAPITVTFDEVTINNQQIRFSSGKKMVVSAASGYSMSEISVATNSSETYISPLGNSVSTGTWSKVSATNYRWTGSATSVTFTPNSACRITTVTVTYAASASCTTNPTVSAGSNSSVTSTTARVSCSSGITSLGSAGCSISSYGFVIGSSANPSIGGSGVTKHEVGTSYTTTSTSFYKDLTGLSAETTYYVRPYATNGNGTAYGTQTSFTTPALPKYTVTLKDDNDTRTQSSYGTAVTLPSRSGCTGYTFAGWSTTNNTSWTTTAPTIINAGSYTPTSNIDLYPVYTKIETGSSATYQKVTSTANVTDGQYLIVCGGQSKAFNGGLTSLDVTQNFISVSISNNSITATNTTTAAEFTIGTSGNNRTITSASGYSIGRTGTTNGFESSTTTTYTNTITISSNNAIITSSGGPTLQYFNSSNNSRFRYYASSQTSIQLYKRIASSTTYYISVPNCCTPLGQINGSVYVTHFWDHFGPFWANPVCILSV